MDAGGAGLMPACLTISITKRDQLNWPRVHVVCELFALIVGARTNQAEGRELGPALIVRCPRKTCLLACSHARTRAREHASARALRPDKVRTMCACYDGRKRLINFID